MAELLDLILGPLQYAFMVRGLISVVIVGIVCATVGTFIVLRGMALFGGALAHAILPGVAVGYLVSGGARGALFWWGLLAAVLTALGIGKIGKRSRLKEDTAIGILFAGMFALGIALISMVRSYAVDLAHFLFGNVLGVSTEDIWLSAVFGGLIVLIIFLLYKEFVVISFDPTLAQTLRLPADLLRYLLLVLIAVAIVVSLHTVGIALMVAMLVTPAATAYLLTRRLPVMISLAALFGASSGVIGLYISFYFSIASGPAIVLVCTAFFLIAMTLTPGKGWLWRVFEKKR